MTLRTGQVLQNRYRIVAELGQGGMGAVYRAWDTRLDISVALKEMVPQPGLDADTLAGLRRQFQQEAQILARLNHPHLVRVGDYFEEDGNTYLVMDFVEGESLASAIGRSGALPESMVLNWADQLLDALNYCHNQGIIHRDIKPQNVIIRPDGRAVLVDFGLVKLWDPGDPHTRTAMRGMGTPEYAPPEQYDVAAGHTDPRSDIYSLGATIYQALTGYAPPTATMRIANPGDYRPPRVLNPNMSARTEAVIMKATELAIDRRFAAAKEMSMAFKGQIPMPVPVPVGGQQVAQAAAVQAPVTRRPPPRRRRTPAWLWVIVALAVVVLVAGISVAALLVTGGGGIGLPLPIRGSSETAGGDELDAELSPTDTPSPMPAPSDTPLPTPTDVPEPSPMPTQTPEPLPTAVPPTPTDTLEPSATTAPPTATPTPAPTSPPTTPPPTATPSPEPSPTSPPSAGPLSFPVPTQLDGHETAEGGHRCLIIVRISGGAPPFTIHHDAFQDVSNEREYYLYFTEAGCTIIHSIRVDSADGQSVSNQYYIASPWCN